MNDDWRVMVRARSDERALELAQRLGRGDLEHELGTGAGQRVIVSRDGDRVFLYAGTAKQARAASGAVHSLAPELSTELRHWDPDSEEWEDPGAGAPPPAAAAAERSRHERADSEAAGFDEYEVRVQLRSHGATRELAERLSGEGLSLVRRWRFLLIGAEDEQKARALADRIRAEAPAGTEVTVEGSFAAVEAYGPHNPFVYFGGLGH